MIRAGRRRRLVMHGVAAVIPAVLCLIDIPQPVAAQQIQTRLPALQAPVSDNLEAQVLGRLSATGQYQPDDLPILARLAVLDSIAMMSNVRTDLRDTPAGSRLEGEIAAFWDSAQVLYEDFSSAPLDLTTLSRAQADSVDVLAAFRRLESTLGEFPEVSNGAAERLRDVSRLLGAMSSVMGAQEADLLRTAPLPTDRAVDHDELREQAQLLANDLVALIGTARGSQRAGGASDRVVPELNDLLAAVQAFIRSLAFEPSFNEIQQSFRVARRGMWNVEARITQRDQPPELKRRWREVRSRFNAISDDFGLPRVSVLTPRAARAAGSSHKFVAQVDRSIAWVDEFRTERGPELRRTPDGARFDGDVVKLRRRLLELRQRATANEPAERLAQALGEIEVTNRQLGARVKQLHSAGRDDIAARFRSPAQAVDSLRTFISDQ